MSPPISLYLSMPMFSLMWLPLTHVDRYSQEQVQIKISSWAIWSMHYFSQLEALLHLLCYKIVTIFVQTTSSPPILIPSTIYKGALLNFLTWLDHVVVPSGQTPGLQDTLILLIISEREKILVNLEFAFTGNHSNSTFFWAIENGI